MISSEQYVLCKRKKGIQHFYAGLNRWTRILQRAKLYTHEQKKNTALELFTDATGAMFLRVCVTVELE